MGPKKTVSFERFPKFWHEPILREWWVGVKANGNAIELQRLVVRSESQKNNERGEQG